jgi:hypothetical protein
MARYLGEIILSADVRGVGLPADGRIGSQVALSCSRVRPPLWRAFLFAAVRIAVSSGPSLNEIVTPFLADAAGNLGGVVVGISRSVLGCVRRPFRSSQSSWRPSKGGSPCQDRCGHSESLFFFSRSSDCRGRLRLLRAPIRCSPST